MSDEAPRRGDPDVKVATGYTEWKSESDDWETVREALVDLNGGYYGHEVAEKVDPAIAALTRLQATETRLREALEYYADEASWDDTIMDDAGELARAALEPEDGLPVGTDAHQEAQVSQSLQPAPQGGSTP